MHRVSAAFLAAALSLLLGSCAKPQSGFTPGKLMPAAGTPLVVGSTTTFTASGTYSLQQPTGYLGLFVQDGQDRVLAKVFKPISMGNGTFILSAKVAIPDTTGVTLAVAMFNDLNSPSLAAMPQPYVVVPR